MHDAANTPPRKITWLELFYDLVYVATIIQLGNVLVDDPSWRGALLFVFLFVAVWWSWTGMMFFFNRFALDDTVHRLLVFAQMFAIATMAISIGGAFGPASAAFALSYFAVRVLLVAFYARAWRRGPGTRALTGRYAVGFGIASLFWLASAFVPEPYRFALWFLGLALEFYVPLSRASRRLQHLMTPDLPHLAERYGLFTIIVLGESFIKVIGGLAEHGITRDALVLSGLGFVIVAGLWWSYFDTVHESIARTTPSLRYLWIYGHLPLTLGMTVVGVALKKLAVLPLGASVPASVGVLLGGAVMLGVVALAVLGSIQGRIGVATLLPWLSAAAVVALLVVAAPYLDAVVFALGLAATVVALVAIGGRRSAPEAGTDDDPGVGSDEPHS